MNPVEAERLIIYTYRRVKRRGSDDAVQVCHFYPGTYTRRAELVAVCPWVEIVMMAEKIGVHVKPRKRSLRVGEESYKRLVVYAAVRETLRSPAKIMELEEVVRMLEEYELHFWFTRILAAFEKGRLAVRRPVQAFKVLHGLD
ncbi:hypothetical protein [Infirmifilum sp.]|uniref:hypothetical protein n=1 Tax=Infirmifilum sp. TaxID=2856575 RepID=UPI003D14F4A3